MASIQERLIEELGPAKVRSILDADGPAGNVPFRNEDEPPHPLYRDYEVERSFNHRAVLLIVDDDARKRWLAQDEEDQRGVPPEPKRRLIDPNSKTTLPEVESDFNPTDHLDMD